MTRTPLAILIALAAGLALTACKRQESNAADFERPRKSAHAAGGHAASAAGGIQFASLSYDEALRKAKQENTLVMIDFYTDWCGWCKKLDKEVFSHPDVGQAAQRIVSIRLDAEGNGESTADKYGVTGFPTILFVDGTGKPVRKVVGFVDATELVEILKELGRGKA